MGCIFLQIIVCAILMVVSSNAFLDPDTESFSLKATKQNVIVSFKDRIESVIDKINKQTFPNIGAKRTALTNAQIEFSNKNQQDVHNFLTKKKIKHQTIWINNKMYAAKVDKDLIKEIYKFKSVASVDKENVTIITGFVGGEEPRNRSSRNEVVERPATITWGIEKIRANQVWSHYTGRGVVVAGIDSGVLYTHEALRANWRQNYGWFDPIGATSVPNDQIGHGTHTIATIVGNNGCGVAPQATWIACKSCTKSQYNPPKVECTDSALMLCGQWVQCPTPPNGQLNQRDCTKAPRIVSNSWGNDIPGNPYYDSIIASWQASEIVPVFALGNTGEFGCGSAKSPGDRPGTIAVGNMDEHDRINPTSSLGPPFNSNLIKPDVAAPGTNVISAWHVGNNQYNSLTGTSYACPHVSGVIALMVEKNPGLTNVQIYNAITRGVVVNQIDTSTAPKCGGISASTFPNHVFGLGRIDAVDCVNAV